MDHAATKAINDLKHIYGQEGITWEDPNAETPNKSAASANAKNKPPAFPSSQIPEHVPELHGALRSGVECNFCKRQQTKLHLCGACKAVRYCGAECQQSDWKSHKPACKSSKVSPKRK